MSSPDSQVSETRPQPKSGTEDAGGTRWLDPQVVAGTTSAALDAKFTDNDARSIGSLFKSAHWSSDGTSIVTNSEDNIIRTYILPEDLLTRSPHTLTPYSKIPHPGPIHALALYPAYTNLDMSTTLLLTSTRDHPIRLHNALHQSLLASYPLVNPNTEAYTAPHSLLFSTSGTHIIAGADSLIACFDLHRPGQAPLRSYPTVASRRHKIVDGGRGVKGIISALAINESGLLAAGTFTRYVGLYSDEGRGDEIATFSLASASAVDAEYTGSGVTQTAWSPDGTVLYVAERMSRGILAFDLVAGKLLGVLQGREAWTNQRIGFAVKETARGHKVLSGGTDGVVREWIDPHLMTDGFCEPSMALRAHGDVVGSTVVYPGALELLATCSGSRDGPGDVEDGDLVDCGSDYSLKVWDMDGGVPGDQGLHGSGQEAE